MDDQPCRSDRGGFRPVDGAADLFACDETGSTNDDVRERALSGAPHGTCVAARAQTAGRGRRGHVWRSPAGGIYLSVLLRPAVPMHAFVGLPVVCALGVLRALRGLAGRDDLAVKWPNDIVCDGRKLAGILVEAGSAAEGPYAVAGIGVNVERPASPAPSPSADTGAADGSPVPGLPPTWLADLARDGLPGFDALAREVRDGVVAACDAWVAAVRAGRAQAGPLAPVLDEYFDACAMLGHQVAALAPDGRELVRGSFSAVDVWGRATVHAADGRDVELTSEQASLRQLD